jgi:hypothetical protein
VVLPDSLPPSRPYLAPLKVVVCGRGVVLVVVVVVVVVVEWWSGGVVE